jgi:hypothetical protein
MTGNTCLAPRGSSSRPSRIERLVLAFVTTQNELWWQGVGHLGEHVAHSGIEVRGARAHAERARIEREDLRHDGTLCEQMQGLFSW